MPPTNVFNELCAKITAKIYSEKNQAGICNPMYFRFCIDLMHITPSVTAEGYPMAPIIRGMPNVT